MSSQFVREDESFTQRDSNIVTCGPKRYLYSAPLSAEEAREIIENPFENGYPYAKSKSYNKYSRSDEYLIPRLCRSNHPPAFFPFLKFTGVGELCGSRAGDSYYSSSRGIILLLIFLFFCLAIFHLYSTRCEDIAVVRVEKEEQKNAAFASSLLPSSQNVAMMMENNNNESFSSSSSSSFSIGPLFVGANEIGANNNISSSPIERESIFPLASTNSTTLFIFSPPTKTEVATCQFITVEEGKGLEICLLPEWNDELAETNYGNVTSVASVEHRGEQSAWNKKLFFVFSIRLYKISLFNFHWRVYQVLFSFKLPVPQFFLSETTTFQQSIGFEKGAALTAN